MDRVLEMLPDLFLKPDGTRIRSSAEWLSYRSLLLDRVVDFEYGGMPPKPEYVRVEPINESYRGSSGQPRQNVYRVHCRAHDRELSFILSLYVPESKGRLPVVLTGDGCYMSMSNEVIYEINRRGMIAAKFDRLEFATDRRDAGHDHGVYALYPGMTFGALSAWAWGYHRAMDAIEQIEFCDAGKVAITGHSRGGKTVLLAGATDERFYLVNPNDSGEGGAGCYRYEMIPEAVSAGEDPHSEMLSDIMVVSYWFGPKMRSYIDREAELPFDQHMLKACVAPRYLLQTEAKGDIWANPKGSYQTLLAAKEAYKLLGVEDHIAACYREGGHAHGYREYIQLLDYLSSCMKDEKPDPLYYEHPYPDMKNIFDWKCPAADR